MSNVFGYCRISTNRQSIERQERNIKAEYPNALTVRETYTGTSLNRPEIDNLLKRIKPGDVIVFDSVSRMSRNAAEGFELYEDLYNRGVELVFLKEPNINTATYREALKRQIIRVTVDTGDKDADDLIQGMVDLLNKYNLSLVKGQIELAFKQSEKEVMDLRQRTREGIETARRSGKQIGQKAGRKLHVKKAAPIKDLIRKYSKDFEGTLKDIDVLAIINSKEGLSVCRNIYYKYKGELREAIDTEAGA